MALVPPRTLTVLEQSSVLSSEERSALQVQINDMVLMAEGMSFILHHSSDLGDGDGMGVMVGREG